ncbi:hypothetical protein ACUNWD_03690 [Sunxiuqinia sp. A32]|uniref:hypothetical protein n=1 Tax=Sunxiuqinia sp. A32 TaxID=3461496 RepID=UPI004045A0B5
MRRLLLIIIVSFIVTVLNGNISLAQVIVEVKPVPPKVKMVISDKPGEAYILIPGHWIWHRPTKNYVWVGPNWTLQRENKKWIPGRWRKMSKGWKWNPGHWEKIYKKRYFFI